jgi:hypothetical protein
VSQSSLNGKLIQGFGILLGISVALFLLRGFGIITVFPWWFNYFTIFRGDRIGNFKLLFQEMVALIVSGTILN